MVYAPGASRRCFEKESKTHVNHQNGKASLKIDGFNDLGHPGSQKTPRNGQGYYGTYNLPVNVTLVEVFGRSHDGGRDDNGQRRADGCFDGDAHEVGQCGYDNDAPADTQEPAREATDHSDQAVYNVLQHFLLLTGSKGLLNHFHGSKQRLLVA